MNPSDPNYIILHNAFIAVIDNIETHSKSDIFWNSSIKKLLNLPRDVLQTGRASDPDEAYIEIYERTALARD